MIKYIIKRLLLMIPVLLGVAILIFTLMYFVPGDPASIALGANATQTQIEAARKAMGLDRPYIVRLGEYLGNVFLHFDFGTSYIYGSSVSAELLARFPKTFLLAFLSMLLSIAVGVPLGIRSAVKANTIEDRISMFVTLVGVSMPTFWLALMLVLLFSLKLGWFPSSGDSSLIYYILPAVSIFVGGVANIARQSRSSMLEVIRADYVTTARAKGVTEHNVIYRHALPNALIPIITICGTHFGMMLGGTIVIDTIFSIAGIGSYLINSINSRDYNAVQGSIIYIAFVFSIVMLIVDIIYAYVDPRIKAQYSSHKKKKAGGSDD